MAIDLINYLGDFLIELLYALFYPLHLVINIVTSFISTLVNSFIGFFASITGMFINLSSLISEFLTGLLPYTWVVLILLGISIAVLQRIYFYIKDISIAGFKI